MTAATAAKHAETVTSFKLAAAATVVELTAITVATAKQSAAAIRQGVIRGSKRGFLFVYFMLYIGFVSWVTRAA